MSGSSSSTTFVGVAVALPSKVRGDVEDEWQEIDWAAWSKGELTVEGNSYLLIFKPHDGNNKAMAAKPLGALIKASGIPPVEESLTFVVSTSDSMHRTYRFAFESVPDTQKFQAIAKTAEAAHKEASRQAAQAVNRHGCDDGSALLEAAVKEAFPSRWPLVYGGAELFGPDPAGDAGSEVLLGHGVAVLLDPPAEETSRRVGSYELIFYGEDDGVKKAVARFPIGPKMALQQQKLDMTDSDGPAVAFDLKPSPAEQPRTITFEDAPVAAMFRRDFSVRQRLMELASMTSKKQQQVESARGELEELRQKSLFATAMRTLRILLLVIILAAVARASLLYQANKDLTPAQCAEALLEDVMNVVGYARAATVGVGTAACELALGSVPALKLQKCLALRESEATALCFSQLVPRG